MQNPLLNKSAIIFCFLFIFINTLSAQLQINTNFDSGNIGAYSIEGDRIDFLINTDELDYTYWTNFKLSGVLDKQVLFLINNAYQVPFLSQPGKESQMVYSYDGENWLRMENHKYKGGNYIIDEIFLENQVQIATYFPFSYKQMRNYINQVKISEWASETILGSSPDEREIVLLTITNMEIPPESKNTIYIIGRQHAAETSSSHMIKGLIDFLLSDNIFAHGFRNNYTWHIVPMLNPDGVFLGKSRANAAGNDINRDWGNNDSHEINIVRNNIETINEENRIDMFIDWHSQMNDISWFNFVYSPLNNTFFPFLSSWTDFDYQYLSGLSACTSESCTARSWAMNNEILSFVMEPTPHLNTWTTESLNDQGKFTSFAINDYFGLYTVGPVDTRVALIKNQSNSPSVGLGTLIINVEAMSNEENYSIEKFQGAFQLDSVFRSMNPIVTFSQDDMLFKNEAYNNNEGYFSENGKVSYEYWFDSGERGIIKSEWTKIVQLSIKYDMVGKKTSINWYNGKPNYYILDAADIDRTGWELEIPEMLSDETPPIRISSFTATVNNGAVTLNWKAENEVDNLGFEVFRSQDQNGGFNLLSGFQANPLLKSKGNSTSENKYYYKDETVEIRKSYYYKIADLNYAGLKSFHEIISVTIRPELLSYFLEQNYPNPFNARSKIVFYLPVAEKVSLKVYDLNGKEIVTLVNEQRSAGRNQINFNASFLASGTYFYRIKTDKFSKVKRMILIK